MRITLLQVSIDERNMRKDSVSREVFRHPEFEGCVELRRIRDWFICAFLPPTRYAPLHNDRSAIADLLRLVFVIPVNIESESAYTPERLFPESIKVMRSKIASIRKAAEALLAGPDGEGASADGDVPMGDA